MANVDVLHALPWQWQEYKTHKDLFVKKFRLKSLPDYLIVHVRRT